MKRTVGSLAFAALLLPVSPAAQEPVVPEWAARWAEDLRFLRETLPVTHANAFHTLPRERWEEELHDLTARVPGLRHHEITVELARIVALIGDGHTRLTLPLAPGVEFEQGHTSTAAPFLPELSFRQFPIRLDLDSRGVFVRAVAAEHRVALGGRVTSLGTLPVEEGIRAVERTIRRDNDMQVLHHLPMHLVLAEVLHACGVTEDLERLPVTLETPAGETLRLNLEVVPRGERVDWVDATSSTTPLHRSRPDETLWFTWLEDARTVYVQFEEVRDTSEETIRAFAERLDVFLREHGGAQLVVDLRRNRGGDNTLLLPLLHAILGSDVDEAGRLYALVGRTTFSAAMDFVLDLERHTQVLFVGEPTGARPNSYGDSRKLRLPNTGLTVRVSTLYWQNHPMDGRPWVAPHLAVELTGEDEVAGRDPVLQAVLDLGTARNEERGEVAGRWLGAISLPPEVGELAVEIVPGENGGTFELALSDGTIRAEVGEAESLGNSVRFRVPLGEEFLEVTATALDDVLVGHVDQGSRRFPFLLGRQD